MTVGDTKTIGESGRNHNWTTSDSSVASVSSANTANVTVTARQVGTATITHTYISGNYRVTDTYTVTVSANIITIEKSPIQVEVDSWEWLESEYEGSWSSEDSSIATVESTGSESSVQVEGINNGTVNIVHTYTQNGITYQEIFPVTVYGTRRVVTDMGTTQLEVGNTAVLTSGNASGTWTVSDNSIISVSGSGSSRTVTGISVGFVTVTHTISNI